MSLSDEQTRTKKAMKLLGFSFPEKLMITRQQLEELPPEYMLAMKREFESATRSFGFMFDNLKERTDLYMCDKCYKEVLSYDEPPDLWGWYEAKDKGYLMCVDCQNKFADKFGYLPKVRRNIDE